jgi:hypothetical protein
MISPRRPAAYIRIPGADGWARHAMAREARYRGWPTPTVYAEDDSNADGSYGQALQRLERAIAAGRHDALLIAAPGNPGQVMGLLSRCTKHGVAVSFLPGPAAAVTGAEAAPPAGAQPQSRAAPGPPAETWDVLAQARLEALASLFPAWRIWLDRYGWHARRRGDYMQGLQPGAPAFHVSARTALDLAAQLCWQQAAEDYAPDGCQAGTGTRAHVV